MKVLIACEFSGIVREAFTAKGHEARSVDILPSEIPGDHYQSRIEEIPKRDQWDIMIAFPPCTHLAVSGACWFKDKLQEQKEAIDFFMYLVNCDIPKIAIENPIGIMSTKYRKPDQIIQPWMFGHGETKATCFWLKGLPKLKPTNIVSLPIKKSERMKMHYMPPSKDRWKNRSRTYQGIADAMAEQWSKS